MDNLPENCKAAVFETVGKDIEITDFDLPKEIGDDSILCKTRFSTICGSDIHTITGRRKEPVPLVLGHEMVADIVKLGKNIKKDGFGNTLKVGDRITWTIMASCGKCHYCLKNLPQKCLSLKKYGHASFDKKDESGLLGGYGEYIHVLPGTAVFKVPETLSDAIAAPANCGVASVINAIETIGVEKGDNVLVLGAGFLGLNTCAILKEMGANEIIVIDRIDARLEKASDFGATKTLNVNETDREEFKSVINELTGGFGLDVAIEVCGDNSIVDYAIDNLTIGGRFMTVGMVSPGNDITIDANTIIRKYLTIKGIHNYRPDHLKKALLFLEKNHAKYPFKDIVKIEYPLEKINEAVETAKSGKYIRVGISFKK